MSSLRPDLTAHLTADEFRAWYWLKSELVAFCRAEGLPTSGLKAELRDRITAYLAGEAPPAPKQRTRRAGTMPDTFALETVVGEGWRCSPKLGAFYRSVCGSGFRFNAAMRDFVHNSAGRTLAEGIGVYEASKNQKRPIAASLEYNQHMRRYFAAHPDATREEAIAAWWAKRGQRRS
ncbi:MAG: SAP domain-containing protein [Bacteroidota bacterium]